MERPGPWCHDRTPAWKGLHRVITKHRGSHRKKHDLALPACPAWITVPLSSSFRTGSPVLRSVPWLPFYSLARNDLSPALPLASSFSSISLDYTSSSKPYPVTSSPQMHFSRSDITLPIDLYIAYWFFPLNKMSSPQGRALCVLCPSLAPRCLKQTWHG